MWLTTIQLSIRNLLLHKLRSFLTMLGTILGVASVIAMLAIGEGSKREALEQIRRLGASNVIIRSVKPDTSGKKGGGSSTTQQQTSHVLEYGLRYKDLDILTSTLPTAERAVPIALIRANAQCGKRRLANARILGTTPEYLHIKNIAVHRGRFLEYPDLHRTANVVVLAAGAARRLFGFEDPLGRALLLGAGAYRVVGVLSPQDSGTAVAGSLESQDLNEDLYIPLASARSRFGELQVIAQTGSLEFERTQLSEITLTVRHESQVSQTAAMARQLLEPHHPKEDFEIQVPLELLRQAQREKRVWDLVLGSIAGISLLVGGIGIMNIMLATVTERTREIGIRRALGARRVHITMQFVVESTVLAASGGLLGIGLGIAIPLVVSSASQIEAVVRGWTVALAFGISVAIGVVFGVYPARRAALKDPIEALRHE
ncbi:MAG: FtsX-like permease family protein [Planctomycetes bacterium]|nr:FtsX-like permease family protein [Planctomycetota bacterium]